MASHAHAMSTCAAPRSRFRRHVLKDDNSPGSGRQMIAVGLWATGTLCGNADLQHCIAAGRTNCAPIR